MSETYICRFCGVEERSKHAGYNLIAYGVCDGCIPDARASAGFPFDGDLCPVCGDKIRYLGNIEYESIFRCLNCRSEWCYD